MTRPFIRLEFKLADMWVGLFWKRADNIFHFWLCLVPCIPIHVWFGIENPRWDGDGFNRIASLAFGHNDVHATVNPTIEERDLRFYWKLEHMQGSSTLAYSEPIYEWPEDAQQAAWREFVRLSR